MVRCEIDCPETEPYLTITRDGADSKDNKIRLDYLESAYVRHYINKMMPPKELSNEPSKVSKVDFYDFLSGVVYGLIFLVLFSSLFGERN